MRRPLRRRGGDEPIGTKAYTFAPADPGPTPWSARCGFGGRYIGPTLTGAPRQAFNIAVPGCSNVSVGRSRFYHSSAGRQPPIGRQAVGKVTLGVT